MTEACANCGSPTTEYTYAGHHYCSKKCVKTVQDARETREASKNGEAVREIRQDMMWEAWREAWRRQSSMGELSGLDERTARRAFERWWQKR